MTVAALLLQHEGDWQHVRGHNLLHPWGILHPEPWRLSLSHSLTGGCLAAPVTASFCACVVTYQIWARASPGSPGQGGRNTGAACITAWPWPPLWNMFHYRNTIISGWQGAAVHPPPQTPRPPPYPHNWHLAQKWKRKSTDKMAPNQDQIFYNPLLSA